jgi:long-subunit fatty acid transport protein
MAGAVVARPADNGSLWYNPAGLAAIDRGRVSASGSVFGLRVRHVPAALEARLGGARIALDADSVDVIAVPHALTAAFRLADGVTLGAGLFATQRDVRKSADVAADEPLPVRSRRTSRRPRSRSSRSWMPRIPSGARA